MKQKGKIKFTGIRPNTNRELMDMVHERDKAIKEMHAMLILAHRPLMKEATNQMQQDLVNDIWELIEHYS